MSSPTPPPEFFDLVQQGDRRATADFVDRFGPIAMAYLGANFTRMSGAEHEELVQEVLLNVIASLPNYDRTRPFKPWFLTITSRRAMDFMEQHSDEWTKGDSGLLPTHVSYEEATGPDGPEELKTQIRTATTTEAGSEFDEADEADEPVELSAIADQADRLRAWMDTLTPNEQVLLTHYTLGASWQEVAEQLAQLGDVAKPASAKVRGHRLIGRAKKLFGVTDDDT